MRRSIGYWARILHAMFLCREVCRSPRCGRMTVGYAIWCRGHVDALLFRPQDEWPSKRRETPRYAATDPERAAWGKP